ncbi:hypothetical protein ACOSQ2_011621 [Xanthoceras sorbifolium]
MVSFPDAKVCSAHWLLKLESPVPVSHVRFCTFQVDRVHVAVFIDCVRDEGFHYCIRKYSTLMETILGFKDMTFLVIITIIINIIVIIYIYIIMFYILILMLMF